MDSSRSHSILTLELTVEDSQTQNGVPVRVQRTGRVSLVDLAGSERLKDTKSSAKMVEEAGAINESLFVLGKVINALSRSGHGQQPPGVTATAAAGSSAQEAAAPAPFLPPYRDSTLTKLVRCV
eukprot:SAG22_NODE_1552_length_4144_cov_3.503090_2_plen_124_part_00